MREVIQIQPALIFLSAEHASDLFGKPGLPIGGEAHHLVLVSVLGEAQELREGRIENAQRMRERDGASYLYLISLPQSPHHTAEIAESVDGDDSGFLKGRCEECAGKVRTVMLDEVHLPRLFWHDPL